MKRHMEENVSPSPKRAIYSKSDTALTTSVTSNILKPKIVELEFSSSEERTMTSQSEREFHEYELKIEKEILASQMRTAELDRQTQEYIAEAESLRRETAEYRAEAAASRARAASAQARSEKAQLEIVVLEAELKALREAKEEEEQKSIDNSPTETDSDEINLTVDFRSAIDYCDETIFTRLKIPTTDPTAKWNALWGHDDFKKHRERLEKLDSFQNSDDGASTFASLVKSSCENEDYNSLYLRGYNVLVPNYLSPDERAVIHEICKYLPINSILEDDCPKPQ